MFQRRSSIKKNLDLSFPCFYEFIPKEKETLIVLLHGYRQKAADVYNALEDILPEQASLLLPEGPFPIPRKAQKTYSLGYSWYFYDSQTDHYLVDFKFPSDLLEELIKSLPIKFKNINFIGFSQGGYLAPFAANRFANSKKVFALCASPRVDIFKRKNNFELFGLNTLKDPYTDFTKAQTRYQEFQKKLKKVHFYSLHGEHAINQGMKEILNLNL